MATCDIMGHQARQRSHTRARKLVAAAWRRVCASCPALKPLLMLAGRGGATCRPTIGRLRFFSSRNGPKWRIHNTLVPTRCQICPYAGPRPPSLPRHQFPQDRASAPQTQLPAVRAMVACQLRSLRGPLIQYATSGPPASYVPSGRHQAFLLCNHVTSEPPVK